MSARPPEAAMPATGNTALRNLCELFRKCMLVGCLALPAHAAYAQDTQFLPEVDSHLTVNSHLRTYLQAKADRSGGDQEQFTFGPSLQFYLKPLIRLQRVTIFDLDDSKSRPLVLESGYRIIHRTNTDPENRATEVATFNFPLAAGVLISDQNTFDFDWQNGNFTWRYHNKLSTQETNHFDPFLPPHPIHRSRTLLRKPAPQMERHRPLRGLPIPYWQAHCAQPLLRARKRHRQKTKPIKQLHRSGPPVVFLIALDTTTACYAALANLIIASYGRARLQSLP